MSVRNCHTLLLQPRASHTADPPAAPTVKHRCVTSIASHTCVTSPTECARCGRHSPTNKHLRAQQQQHHSPAACHKHTTSTHAPSSSSASVATTAAAAAAMAAADADSPAQAFLRALLDENTATAMQLLNTAQAAGPEQLSALLSATDTAGLTALVLAAASRGNEAMVSLLLAAGAQLDPADSMAHGALLSAADRGKATAVRLLLQLGVPADVRSAMHLDRTALHAAAVNGHTDVVGMLLAAGADAAARDDTGDTPLMLAATTGRKDAMSAMLAVNAGLATVNAVDSRGHTALHRACAAAHPGTVQLLLDAGADPLAGEQASESLLARAAVAAIDTAVNTAGGQNSHALEVLLTHPRTAHLWTAGVLTAAAWIAALPRLPEASAAQRQVVSRLLQAAVQDAGAAHCSTAGFHAQPVQYGSPFSLSLIASICMSEWLEAAASVDAGVEQRTGQQLVVGAAGLLQQQEQLQADEEGEQQQSQQQVVSEFATALQAQRL